jgi:hypothetical protein
MGDESATTVDGVVPLGSSSFELLDPLRAELLQLETTASEAEARATNAERTPRVRRGRRTMPSQPESTETTSPPYVGWVAESAGTQAAGSTDANGATTAANDLLLS